jgi:hypothetical protein
MSQMNLLEQAVFDSARNLTAEDLVYLGNQAQLPQFRRTSGPLAQWLWATLETEYDRRRNHDSSCPRLFGLGNLTDHASGEALHGAVVLLDAQASQTAADFARDIVRLVAAHCVARLTVKDIALSN